MTIEVCSECGREVDLAEEGFNFIEGLCEDCEAELSDWDPEEEERLDDPRHGQADKKRP